MYKKIEEPPRMTDNEASETYPDYYILMQRDGKKAFEQSGTVLFIGDNDDELFSLQVNIPVLHGVIIEGINITRRLCLGGLVVGACN
jgi:hypothetical protein